MANDPLTTAPPLAIRLFGAFEVQVHGRPLPPLRVRKDKWLLALLTLEQGHPLARTGLAQTLWPFPETLESHAADNLRRSLYVLRKALGVEAPRIAAPTPETVALDLADVECDVVAFDRAIAQSDAPSLQKAVTLYRGALLAECTESWALPAREKRRAAYCSALLDLTAQSRACHDYQAAQNYLRQALAVDALWEDANRQLMEVLACSGELNGALTVYQELCRALARTDLRAVPASETTELYRKMRHESRQSAQPLALPLVVTLPSVPKPHHLPSPLTELIGREDAIVQIESRLHRARLVTLTGVGGVGKTRLALAVADAVAAYYPDGAYLVELAALSDPKLVPQTLASALELREQLGRPLRDVLADFLKPKRLLLILDNCEHLLAACAELAQVLLSYSPGLRILTTSRQALGITGEIAWRVPSLLTPDPARLSISGSDLLGEVSGYEAVRLFVERAEANQKTFQLTPENALAVAQICHRLDGIPLALELAAACVRSLSVEEINHKLDNRFRLLTGGSHVALPRHQTLRGLMDWSYDLLTHQEKVLLHRLSLFAGGWSLEAAEQICAGESLEEWAVLKLLSSLVDRSLVVAEPQEEHTRYRLLETVRQYAQDRLGENNESAARNRHQAFFVAIAEAAEPQLRGPKQAVWLHRLEREHDNLRAALEWSNEWSNKEVALRIAGSLWRFWHVRGYLSEGWERLAGALAATASQAHTPAWVKARSGAAALARSQGNFTTAQTLFIECLAQYQSLSDKQGIATSLLNLAVMAYYKGNYTAARTLSEESLAIQRELGNQQGIADALHNLGMIAHNQGDYAAARRMYQEGLAIQRELGDKGGIAYSLHNLGSIAHCQGDDATARALSEDSLTIQRELGNKRGRAASLNLLGDAAFSQGDYTMAHTLHEESLTIQRELEDKQSIAYSLHSLGMVAHHQGDYAAARRMYQESLTMLRELGDKGGIAASLEAFAALAFALEQLSRAARLWGAAAVLRQAMGSHLAPSERPHYDRQVAQARVALSGDAFAVAWSEGRDMGTDQAIEDALNPIEGVI